MSAAGDWLRDFFGHLGAGGAILLRVAAIALFAWIGSRFASRLIRRFRETIASRMTEPEQVKRAETLGRVFRYLATVVISLIAGVLIAIGFGAQSLVKDYFTGFFLLRGGRGNRIPGGCPLPHLTLELRRPHS